MSGSKTTVYSFSSFIFLLVNLQLVFIRVQCKLQTSPQDEKYSKNFHFNVRASKLDEDQRRIVMMKNEGSLFQTLPSALLSNLTQLNHAQRAGESSTSTSSRHDTFTNRSSISLVKGSKQDYYSDTEVILSPNAIISPDVFIGRFVDSKVTIDEMLLEELGFNTSSSSTLSPVVSPSTETIEINLPIAESVDQGLVNLSGEEDEDGDNGQNEGPKNIVGGSLENDSDISIFLFSSRDKSNEGQRVDKFEFFDNVKGMKHSNIVDDSNDATDDIEELSRRETRSHTCYHRFNTSSGRFNLNFTQDCIYLLISPEPQSRIIFHCEAMRLSNCSVFRDVLTINLKGDLRFGRNSYLYCGNNAYVRTTSLKSRLSIRVRQDLKVKEETMCTFFARKQRFYNSVSTGTRDIDECGRHGRNAKIIGGKSVEPGVFPWACQLDITRTDGTQTACTGSLVSNQYVLTAAHCLKNTESISVFLGGTDRHAFTGSEVTVQAEKFILHRAWNPRTLIADLALVKLTEPVRFTDEISPVCLPGRTLRRETMTGRNGVAAGWGRLDTSQKAPQQLYRVKLPFLSDTLCFFAYRRFFRRELMMCTESTVEKSICYGDSGGPLMYKRNDKVYQLGVASYSSSKVCGESYDVFTKLGDDYVEWINKRIGSE